MKVLLRVWLGLILFVPATSGPVGWRVAIKGTGNNCCRVNFYPTAVEDLLGLEPVEKNGRFFAIDRSVGLDELVLVGVRAGLLHELMQVQLVSDQNEWPFVLGVGALYAVWKLLIQWRAKHRLPRTSNVPPLNAEFLFYLFLDAQNCDALVGDLEERYRLIYKKFGQRRANFWYWTQAIRSVGPIVWAWMKKVLKTLSGLAALLELYRRIRH